MLLRKTRLPGRSNKLLLIRTDAIGDYVLFRNYIHFLRDDASLKDHRFYLLGNKVFRSIAEKFDAEIIDHFIWIDPAIFFDISGYRKIKLAFALKLKRFDIVINPIHSRIWEIDEFISGLGAKKTIGSSGDDANIHAHEKLMESASFYDQLIDVPETSVFEFIRNKVFFEKLCPGNKSFPKLSIPVEKANKDENISSVIISPGAGAAYRRWDTSRFADVMITLNNTIKIPLQFIITGSANDNILASEIIECTEKKLLITDLTGKTDLGELAQIIGHAKLLISNESSAVHIAAAIHTPAICISNGNHFGRFNPYPKDIADNIFTIYPDKKFYDPSLGTALVDEYRYSSGLDINVITPGEVSAKAIEVWMKYYSPSLQNA
jgi:ADP-heptose:LPS heptosyltransferase